jgi:hypothetical protein
MKRGSTVLFDSWTRTLWFKQDGAPVSEAMFKVRFYPGPSRVYQRRNHNGTSFCIRVGETFRWL